MPRLENPKMMTTPIDTDDDEEVQNTIDQLEGELEDVRHELQAMLRAVNDTAAEARNEVDEYGIDDEDRLDLLLGDLENEFRDVQSFRREIDQLEDEIARLKTFLGGDA